MKKLQIDLLVVLILAVMIAGAILVWGGALGLTAPDTQGLALIGVALGALVLAFIVSFDGLARWSGAVRRLRSRLQLHGPRIEDTTQGNVPAIPEKQNASRLTPLRERLQSYHGFRWRYRQPWLLLSGDEAVVGRLLPELVACGWLVTDAAVLVWGAMGADGHVDEVVLRHLRRMR